MGPVEFYAEIARLTEAQLEELRPPAPRRFDERAMAYLRDRVFYWIDREIRYRYRPGGAPPCRRVEIMYAPISDELELRFEIYDGQHLCFTTGSSIEARALSQLGFDRICRMYFDGASDLFNDRPMARFDWRADVELRNRIEDCSRGLLPLPTTEEGYRMVGIDPGRRDEYAVAITRRTIYGGVTYQEAIHFGGGYRAGRTPRDEQQRAYEFLLAAATLPSFADRSEAEERGEKLLREWLSPEQLAQYHRERQFEVIGCHSKRRYRISRDSVYNVELLDAQGEVEEKICFVPEGGLVLGDQMLAQKVALETDENGAMAVANRQWVGPPMAGMLRTLSNLINPFTT